MDIFKVVVLVCSFNTPADECTDKTAIDRFPGPILQNELQCNQHTVSSQMMMAPSEMYEPGKMTLVIRCLHERV